MLADPDDAEAYIDSDMALHRLLYEYAESALLGEVLSMVKTYNLRVRYVIERALADAPEERRAVRIASTREHIAILDALERRDPDLACNAVYEHITSCISREAKYHRCE